MVRIWQVVFVIKKTNMDDSLLIVFITSTNVLLLIKPKPRILLTLNSINKYVVAFVYNRV